jgi:hypothetical protein
MTKEAYWKTICPYKNRSLWPLGEQSEKKMLFYLLKCLHFSESRPDDI